MGISKLMGWFVIPVLLAVGIGYYFFYANNVSQKDMQAGVESEKGESWHKGNVSPGDDGVKNAQGGFFAKAKNDPLKALSGMVAKSGEDETVVKKPALKKPMKHSLDARTKKLIQAQIKRQMAEDYGEFLRDSGLSDVDKNTFSEAVLDHQLERIETAFLMQDETKTDAEILKLFLGNTGKRDSSLSMLLGKDGLDRFLALEKDIPRQHQIKGQMYALEGLDVPEDFKKEAARVFVEKRMEFAPAWAKGGKPTIETIKASREIMRNPSQVVQVIAEGTQKGNAAALAVLSSRNPEYAEPLGHWTRAQESEARRNKEWFARRKTRKNKADQ